MDRDEMLDAITAQRHRLIATLEELDDEQWHAASWCVGWDVVHVVGHLVSLLDIPVRTWIWNTVKRRGDFDGYADLVARQYASVGPEAVLDAYRSHAGDRFAPPVVGPIAPLVDVCTHTRDIERPLGIPCTLPDDAVTTSLDYLCSGKRGFVPPSRTTGLRFEATDLDWSTGEGEVVLGPGEAIMLAVAARPGAIGDLSGPGVSALAARIDG